MIWILSRHKSTT